MAWRVAQIEHQLNVLKVKLLGYVVVRRFRQVAAELALRVLVRIGRLRVAVVPAERIRGICTVVVQVDVEIRRYERVYQQNLVEHKHYAFWSEI